MFGNYNDLILVLLILGQVATIYLIVLSRSESDSKKNKILITNNTKLKKENNTLRFSIPRLIQLAEQIVDNDKERKIQVQQIQGYLGEVLEISNLIGFDNKDLSAADVIEALKTKIKWAEETRKYQTNQNERDYYNPE